MAKRKRLGDLLKEVGLLTEDQIENAIASKKEGQMLGDALLEKGYITEQQLIEVLEFQLGIPHVTLYNYPIDTSLMNLVSKDFASRNLIFPLKKDKDQLIVAMADPMDYFAIDDLTISTGFQISPVIAKKDEILQGITKYYHLSGDSGDLSGEDSLDDAPAIRQMDLLLQAGIQLKASDIHIDPQEDKVIVRYRVDGILRTEKTLPKNLQNSLTARVKIMANLNITETRLPQDGRIKTTLENKTVDLRISTLPTVFGEKIVIRILDLGNVLNRLDDLGFSERNYERYLSLIEKPSGLVLITGPTGSGKSSTLYASLNYLNSEQVNIVTVEDPVEYQLNGINQVQVNSGIGLSFSRGLRSILRQDPNIIMVGEIRDTETAEIAIRASLTGHLVFSTLHTNNAIATIPRLVDMDIEPYLVVSSLSGIVAQRLVRRICRDCKTSYPPSQMEWELFEERKQEVENLYKGKGCASCQYTGYRGRMAIHEVLVIDDKIREMMMNQQSLLDIRHYAAQNGMIFLVEDGLEKAKKGFTTIEEVLRVSLDE